RPASEYGPGATELPSSIGRSFESGTPSLPTGSATRRSARLPLALLMLKGSLRTLRYARGWRAGTDVVTEETAVRRANVDIPATPLCPAEHRGALPAWIALGGISCMGRTHPQLVRFAKALASSGAAVLIPEIP